MDSFHLLYNPLILPFMVQFVSSAGGLESFEWLIKSPYPVCASIRGRARLNRENVLIEKVSLSLRTLMDGAAIDNLSDQILHSLHEPLTMLSENTICERLDKVFDRWSRDYSFENLAAVSLPVGGQHEKIEHLTISFWRSWCTITVPAGHSRGALSINADFVCPSNEKGAFMIHQKGSFLSAALKGLHIGEKSEELDKSFLKSSLPVSMLYLIGFDREPEVTFVSGEQEDTKYSFLEHKSLSAHFFKIFRTMSLTLRQGGESRSIKAYLLFMDQRGIALLSRNPFPDQYPFELELQGTPAHNFSIHSLQRRHVRADVDCYQMNFERFLPEKSFESLAKFWGNEKRENVRVDRVVPLEVELSKHKRFYAITDNISLKGMRIVHRHAIPPGVHLNCRIRLGGLEGDITVRGVMIWKEALMSGLNITGIGFISMDSSVQRRLLRYLEREIIAELMDA
jgi:hypothetical protein